MTLGSKGRGVSVAVFGPVAGLLVRLGVSPDVVTFAGTIAVMTVALTLLPTGRLLAGSLLIAFFAVTDAIDGQMARKIGRTGPWGAFLDSTLDRFADGSVFAGLAIWGVLASDGGGGLNDPLWAAGGALACLLLGSIVPYARARAEGLGMKASVGLAERTDRMVVALAATLAVGIGAPVAVLTLALVAVALASVVTIGQRMATVYVQSQENPSPPPQRSPGSAT